MPSILNELIYAGHRHTSSASHYIGLLFISFIQKLYGDKQWKIPIILILLTIFIAARYFDIHYCLVLTYLYTKIPLERSLKRCIGEHFMSLPTTYARRSHILWAVPSACARATARLSLPSLMMGYSATCQGYCAKIISRLLRALGLHITVSI